MLRAPIVAVLGHIDHGKTTLLDRIRNSSVAAKEVGAITQHIGATEVPIETIYKLCSEMCHGNLELPGLLFIDTPGHRSFNALRERGGALADFAVLIVDINEGLMPQTIDSIKILKAHKTPYVIAANKIDKIDGWRSEPQPFIKSYREQSAEARENLDNCIYRIIGRLWEFGLPCERYDLISDFKSNIGIVPISAGTGEGISDLMLIIMGLAQRYLKNSLVKTGVAKGTVLEVKQERGLGMTLNAILYDGELQVGDEIAIQRLNHPPIITKIKAIMEPSPLGELRDNSTRFRRIQKANSAKGIRIVAPGIVDDLSGMPFALSRDFVPKSSDTLFLKFKPEKQGIVIKADSVGALEALIMELGELKVPIVRFGVGALSKRDVSEAIANLDDEYRVILAFNVPILEEVRAELENSAVKLIYNNVIYKLIDDLKEFLESGVEVIEIRPAAIKLLPEFIFRRVNPAIIGVKIMEGELKPKMSLISQEGEFGGFVKEIQDKGKNLQKAVKGDEVAVSLEKINIGRTIRGDEILYSNLLTKEIELLFKNKEVLTDGEVEILELIQRIKSKKVL